MKGKSIGKSNREWPVTYIKFMDRIGITLALLLALFTYYFIYDIILAFSGPLSLWQRKSRILLGKCNVNVIISITIIYYLPLLYELPACMNLYHQLVSSQPDNSLI